MKREYKILFASFIFTVFLFSLSEAKWARMKRDDFIKASQVIVIGDLIKVSSKDIDQLHDQLAEFKLSKNIRGKVGREFSVVGSKKGICTPLVDFTNSPKGKYLLFLREDGSHYCDVNGGYSVLEIKDGKVKWYKDDQSLEMIDTSLDAVLQQINHEG